ncbi:MAG: phosphonopyruvate decarboxylase [Deltaproteobacteria bacterium]|nr:phosphonopyruvate decarboxylase [Deltaproteobacteria bacterium]
MITAESFIQAAKGHGFSLYTGVPCSYLKPFINYVIDTDGLEYVGATNEGDAVAIASGAALGGKRSVVMFQNSGFGNTVNPLTSLNMIFDIPCLVITTLRGEPGGPKDEPQHALMGQITTGLFELMRIPWEYFPTEESEIAPVLERATRHMNETRQPYGLVMKKDSVAPHKLKAKAEPRPVDAAQLTTSFPWPSERPSRTEVLLAMQRSLRKGDVVVATTGHTGRELYALEDKPNQLYMVGSMGCAGSFGLGLALAQPSRRVLVLDGDGAALMRLGALATLGFERPKNLLHLLLDNELHESTGGQSTVSHSVDLGLVAAASGYPKVLRVPTSEGVAALVAAETAELTFAHVKTRPGSPEDLPRPTVTPTQVKDRLTAWMKENP